MRCSAHASTRAPTPRLRAAVADADRLDVAGERAGHVEDEQPGARAAVAHDVSLLHRIRQRDPAGVIVAPQRDPRLVRRHEPRAPLVIVGGRNGFNLQRSWLRVRAARTSRSSGRTCGTPHYARTPHSALRTDSALRTPHVALPESVILLDDVVNHHDRLETAGRRRVDLCRDDASGQRARRDQPVAGVSRFRLRAGARRVGRARDAGREQPVRADARCAGAARGNRRQGAAVLRRARRSAERSADRVRRDGRPLRDAHGVRASRATKSSCSSRATTRTCRSSG